MTIALLANLSVNTAMELMDKHFEKIDSRQMNVAVVGLGYVGLPLALEFVEAGFNVSGIDINIKKIDRLNEGDSYVEDVSNDRLKKALAGGKLIFSSEYKKLEKADSISICVPTPLRKTKDPDLSYIIAAVNGVKPWIQNDQLVVLESTTYPGTTREIFGRLAAELDMEIGRNIFFAFSPERIDPGNKEYNTTNTPKVVGGLSKNCTEYACRLYQTAVKTVVPAKNSEEAEMVKLLENTFRAVNIALVNEMLLMCDRMDIDIWNVINGAATKPFGFTPFYPGPGIGGHCIPLDPTYLSWKAKTFNFYNRFIELASDINGNMPRFVVQKSAKVLNEISKPLMKSKILIAGVSYKPNVRDTRESPALEIIKQLTESGAILDYYDPLVDNLSHEGMENKSISEAELKAGGFDLAIVVTHHNFDKNTLLSSAHRILDCRNFFGGVNDDRIVKL